MNPQFIAISRTFGKAFVASVAYTIVYEGMTWYLNRPTKEIPK